MQLTKILKQKCYCRAYPQSRSVYWQLQVKSVIAVLCTVCLLSGCKTSKVNTASSDEILTTEETFFSSVLDNSLHFNTLTSRLKIELATPDKELSARAVLKMRNDDVISISVQPFLGIEAFKIELKKDSVKLIDRLNKRYMTESYEQIKGKTAVDFNFHNLQALLSNSMFIPGKDKLDADAFRFFRYTKNRGKEAEFSIKDATGFLYRFVANSEEKLLSTTIRDNSGTNMLKWVYDNFQNMGDKQFPVKMTARLLSDEKDKGTVTLLFSDPVIDSQITVDFKIPAGYTRVTFSQIIKTLEIK